MNKKLNYLAALPIYGSCIILIYFIYKNDEERNN